MRQSFKMDPGTEFLPCGKLRINSEADGTIGNAPVLFDVSDRRFHIIHIVEGIKNTHDADPRFHCEAVESFDHLLGIRIIAEQVASTRKSREERDITDRFLDLFKTFPRGPVMPRAGSGICAASSSKRQFPPTVWRCSAWICLRRRYRLQLRSGRRK